MQPCDVSINLLCLDGQLDPSMLLPVHTTCLRYLLLATMVNVEATLSAPGPLVEEAIEEAATVVTPRWMVVVSWCKLMWDWFLLAKGSERYACSCETPLNAYYAFR